ncbi:MAG: TolC family outer membrane protein [Magnetococcales bacterium]|nr:TolC family outer membrane protein [Magnetococcales bacterium]
MARFNRTLMRRHKRRTQKEQKQIRRWMVGGLLAVSMLSGRSVMALTLNQAVGHALRVSPTVNIERSRLKSAGYQIDQAQAGYFPSVDLALGQGREWYSSPSVRAAQGTSDLVRGEASVTLSQMLFDGFSTKAQVDQAKAQKSSAEYSVREVSEDLAFSVVEAYLDILEQRELNQLSQEQVDLHGKILSQVHEMSTIGLGTNVDVHQAESRLSLTTAERVAAQNDLNDALAAFKQVVGLKPEGLSRPWLKPTAIPRTLEKAIEMAMEFHPVIQSGLYDLKAAEAAHLATEASFWPQVDLSLSYSNNDNASGTRSYTTDTLAMVRMNYNLFRGGSDLSKRRKSHIKIQEERERLQSEKTTLIESVSTAYNALTSARGRLDHLRNHLKENKGVTESYHEQFRMGQRTLLDVLNSEDEVFSARRSLIRAEYDGVRNAYSLLRHMGTLTMVLNTAVKNPEDPKKRLPNGPWTVQHQPRDIPKQSDVVAELEVEKRPEVGLDQAVEPIEQIPDIKQDELALSRVSDNAPSLGEDSDLLQQVTRLFGSEARLLSSGARLLSSGARLLSSGESTVAPDNEAREKGQEINAVEQIDVDLPIHQALIGQVAIQDDTELADTQSVDANDLLDLATHSQIPVDREEILQVLVSSQTLNETHVSINPIVPEEREARAIDEDEGAQSICFAAGPEFTVHSEHLLHASQPSPSAQTEPSKEVLPDPKVSEQPAPVASDLLALLDSHNAMIPADSASGFAPNEQQTEKDRAAILSEVADTILVGTRSDHVEADHVQTDPVEADHVQADRVLGADRLISAVQEALNHEGVSATQNRSMSGSDTPEVSIQSDSENFSFLEDVMKEPVEIMVFVAATGTPEEAEQLKLVLLKRGYPVAVVPDAEGDTFSIFCGPFEDMEQAENVQLQLESGLVSQLGI